MSCITTADPALVPDIEAFEERVAIMVYEGGIPTDQAKDLAAQAQGFCSQAHYWAWLRVYVDRKRLGYGQHQNKPASQSGGWVCFSFFLRRGVGMGALTSS